LLASFPRVSARCGCAASWTEAGLLAGASFRRARPGSASSWVWAGAAGRLGAGHCCFSSAVSYHNCHSGSRVCPALATSLYFAPGRACLYLWSAWPGLRSGSHPLPRYFPPGVGTAHQCRGAGRACADKICSCEAQPAWEVQLNRLFAANHFVSRLECCVTPQSCTLALVRSPEGNAKPGSALFLGRFAACLYASYLCTASSMLACRSECVAHRCYARLEPHLATPLSRSAQRSCLPLTRWREASAGSPWTQSSFQLIAAFGAVVASSE